MAGELSIEERRLAWIRQRAPKAHALLERVYEAQEGLDEQGRAGLRSLEFALGNCLRNGQEVDDEFAAEAEEGLRRAEGRQ